MYTFRYRVEACSNENENETNIYQGTLLVDSYKEAVKYLICQYGEKTSGYFFRVGVKK